MRIFLRKREQEGGPPLYKHANSAQNIRPVTTKTFYFSISFQSERFPFGEAKRGERKKPIIGDFSSWRQSGTIDFWRRSEEGLTPPQKCATRLLPNGKGEEEEKIFIRWHCEPPTEDKKKVTKFFRREIGCEDFSRLLGVKITLHKKGGAIHYRTAPVLLPSPPHI